MTAAERMNFNVAEKRSLIREDEFKARVVDEKELRSYHRWSTSSTSPT